MRRIALIAALLVFATAAVAVGGSRSHPRRSAGSPLAGSQPGGNYAPAVAATNRLALTLMPRLGGGIGNAVFSPYSIETALAMVDQGAAGETEREIDHVLGVDVAPALTFSGSALASALASAAPGRGLAPQLDVANTLWVQSGLSLKHTFTSTLAGSFGAAPQTADFRSAPEAGRAAVNSWVAEHTAGQIENLMPEGSITAVTRLVLANAIYLKARWADPFQTSLTAQGPFYPASGPAVEVPFMTQETFRSLPYVRTAHYRAVSLPYRGSTLSMLAVMPSPGTLGTFERQLTSASLGRIVHSLVTQSTQIVMPRLKLNLNTSLNEALSALGMPIAFTDSADFSGITSKVALTIADVQHGATLKVDEAGTVAAAATGIVMVPTSAQLPPPARMIMNHPFLLFIRDRATGAILFAARVANPASG